MSYSVGDRIAHPMHGAGIIDGIVTRKIGGKEREYYVISIQSGSMMVMVPVEGCENVGVRPIIGSEEAERILRDIPGIQVSMTTNWNKRYRENMLKIKSGDLMEVAEVIKGLTERDKERGLSTGERKMLQSARQILISELMLSQSASYEEIESRVDSAMLCSN